MYKLAACLSALILMSSAAMAAGKVDKNSQVLPFNTNEKGGLDLTFKENHTYVFNIVAAKGTKLECYLLISNNRRFIQSTKLGNVCNIEMTALVSGRYTLVIFNIGKAQRMILNTEIQHPEGDGKEADKEPEEEGVPYGYELGDVH